MAPGLAAILNIGGMVINSVVSIVQDKKRKKDGEVPEGEELLIPPIGSAVRSLATGVKLSSKRLLNLGGTGVIISIAVADYASNGLTVENIALFSVGAIFSLIMAWITKKSEE